MATALVRSSLALLASSTIALTAYSPSVWAQSCDEDNGVDLVQAGQRVFVSVFRSVRSGGAESLQVSGTVTRSGVGRPVVLDYSFVVDRCVGRPPVECACLVGEQSLSDDCVPPGLQTYLASVAGGQDVSAELAVIDTAHSCLDELDAGPEAEAGPEAVFVEGCSASAAGAPKRGPVALWLPMLILSAARRRLLSSP